jgi:two-component system, sensor histidine kinase
MQPTCSTARTASDKGACKVMSVNGFDVRPAMNGHDILLADSPLETRIRSSARITPSLVEELRTQNRRKDEFLAMLAHELRSPLASIQSAVGVLRKPAGDERVTQGQLHDLIERQARHMARLVAGLLDVSQITSGQFRLQCARIDVRAVLDNAIETIEPEIRRRNQRLARTLPQSSRWLLADVDRLEQVFVNLLGNASKYTDEGGELSLSMQVDDQGAVVCVRDTGIGIAPDALPHVFDLFRQCDPAALRSRSGLGVGLALVRALVELHGGSVRAESAGLGRGSEFTVSLPYRS